MPALTLLHGNIALALCAAITWGGGDFSGGMSVRSSGGTIRAALRAVFLSHSTSLLALLVLLALRHDPLPTPAPLFWGLGAGIFGAVSILSFYIALAGGAMGSSAAISGVLAAAIPSVVSIYLEGAPGLLRLTGFLLAVAAIWLIASGPATAASSRRTFVLAVVSGLGFGIYFVALRMAGAGGVLWPLALSRSVSISVCGIGLLVFALRRAASASANPVTPPAAQSSRRWIAWAISTAILDSSGNLLYIAATRAGRLDVASVLASLYPATTILLASWLLKERLSARQGFGMALAVAAVILITL